MKIQGSESGVLFPETLDEHIQADGLVLALRIPKDLTYFNGHFDEIAVVPGVVQIQWAVHYARQYLGLTRVFSHMESVKFKELLLPGQELELALHYLQQAGKLTFCYRSTACEYSSGRIYFHDHHV
ncbi:ApeI family dehydratase [Methylomonas fluvii]|uniref:AMP-dependent synthetase n=1 Tax=Methylomonas fluvii TaxID=1854564 RepID=A0ABR9DI16_9GAMM|nr:AMP-dependent synthetase [Methylomonas fluvii]MBD9362748.1 AMP-dependent synthetase [Methylomonas fluvii]CAD6875892.1 AMP-dependent synthetase and ligase [Methylomonas fluvii]